MRLVFVWLAACFTLHISAQVLENLQGHLATDFVSPNEKSKLSITIMLPQDFLRLRNFQVCISREITRINRGSYNFTKKFELDSYIIIIHKNYNDIVDTICTLLNTQSSAAIYINYNDYSNIEALNSMLFLKLANFIQMPVLTYIPNAYATNKPRSNEIQLAPTLFHQVEAMMSLLVRYEWYKYSIIVADFSGSRDDDEFLKAAEHFSNTQIQNTKLEMLSVVKLNMKRDRINKTEIIGRFKLLSPETRVIILHCHIDDTNLIFDIAHQLGLTTWEHIWILSRNVIENQLYNNFKFTNFPVGSLAIWSNTSADGICDTIVYNSVRLWANALENYYHTMDANRINTILPHTKCWNKDNLSFTDDMKYHYGNNFHKYLRQVKLSKSEKEVIAFDEKGVQDSVEFKIWNLNSKFEWKQVGSWRNKEIVMGDIIWPGYRHKPPSGKPAKFHLKLVTLEEPPFVIYKDPGVDGTCIQNSIHVRLISNANRTLNYSNPLHYKCASGFYVDLILEISAKLQFTFEVYEVGDKAWGGRRSGKWNGLIQDILTEKADLVMTSLKITTERSEFIDFSLPFMETGIAILVSLRPGKISPTAFLKPYDYLIWIMLLVVTLHSVAIALFLFEYIIKKSQEYSTSKRKPKYEYKCIKNIDTADIANTRLIKFEKTNPTNYLAFTLRKVDNKKDFSLGKSLWLVWVILFRAATKVLYPEGFSSKFVANVWAVLALAFTASYTANLAAFMIIKEEYPDLSGIEDNRLLNPYAYKPPYKFGTVRSGSTEEILKNNHPGMYTYMKEHMVKDIKEGINRVKEGNLDAFIYDAVVLDYRAGQDNGCKLRVVGDWYAVTSYGIGMLKGSKYKDMIDRKILEYMYTGELERIQKFWFSGSCNKDVDERSGSQRLDIAQSSSTFVLILCGICLATIILVVELIYDRWFKKPMKVWFYERTTDENKSQELKKRTCDFFQSYSGNVTQIVPGLVKLAYYILSIYWK